MDGHQARDLYSALACLQNEGWYLSRLWNDEFGPLFPGFSLPFQRWGLFWESQQNISRYFSSHYGGAQVFLCGELVILGRCCNTALPGRTVPWQWNGQDEDGRMYSIFGDGSFNTRPPKTVEHNRPESFFEHDLQPKNLKKNPLDYRGVWQNMTTLSNHGSELVEEGSKNWWSTLRLVHLDPPKTSRIHFLRNHPLEWLKWDMKTLWGWMDSTFFVHHSVKKTHDSWNGKKKGGYCWWTKFLQKFSMKTRSLGNFLSRKRRVRFLGSGRSSSYPFWVGSTHGKFAAFVCQNCGVKSFTEMFSAHHKYLRYKIGGECFSGLSPAMNLLSNIAILGIYVNFFGG